MDALLRVRGGRKTGEGGDLPPYALLDAGLSTVGLGFWGYRETTAALSIRNLTNTRAADAGFAGIDYPLAARTVHLQIRQEL